jgi:hypothetical protein
MFTSFQHIPLNDPTAVKEKVRHCYCRSSMMICERGLPEILRGGLWRIPVEEGLGKEISPSAANQE